MQRRQLSPFLLALCHFCGIDGAQPDHARRYLVVLQSEAPKIFAAHNRRGFDDVLSSDCPTNRARDALNQPGIIICRWSDLGVADCYYRSEPIRYSGRRGGSLRDTVDRGKDHLAHLFPVSPDSELKVNLVWDYVVSGAAVY